MKLKEDLLKACYDYANLRLAKYKNEIEIIKESIENNDKGSDEDDDSGNGKLFIDLEKNVEHLNDALKAFDTLKMISSKIASNTVVLGSVVKTTNNNFYISISAGKIDIDGSTSYIAISRNSPIGLLLKNKQKGESIEFNGNTFKILEVI